MKGVELIEVKIDDLVIEVTNKKMFTRKLLIRHLNKDEKLATSFEST